MSKVKVEDSKLMLDMNEDGQPSLTVDLLEVLDETHVSWLETVLEKLKLKKKAE